MPIARQAQIEELEKLLLPPSQNTVYDLSAFLTAPAVKKVASASADTPVIITVPPSPYPSPLADNLGPDTVKSVHDHLCGSANGNNTKQRRRGNEIWLSWKRAWDINNNHYIEGRQDPVWIGTEYKKLKIEFEAERAAKRLQQLNQSGFRSPRYLLTEGPYKRLYQPKPPPDRPGRRWVATGHVGKTVKKTGHQVNVKPGDVSFFKDPNSESRVVRTLPSGHPTKTYLAGAAVPLVHKDAPQYRTSVEYIAVAKPQKSAKLKSYGTLQRQRRQANEANLGEDGLLPENEHHLRLPPSDKFKPTISPPLAEDIIEDTRTEVQELLVTRPIGDVDSIHIETDGLNRPPLSYKSLRESRNAKRPMAAPLKENGTYKKINKQIKTWKQTGYEVISNDPYREGTRYHTYPHDVVGVDLEKPGGSQLSEIEYSLAPVGTKVDGFEVEEIPEWQEIDVPNPKRFVRSHAHTVQAIPRQQPKRVTFADAPTRNASSFEPASQTRGDTGVTGANKSNVHFPTIIDHPNILDIFPDGGLDTASEPESDSDSGSDSDAERSNRTIPLSIAMDDREEPIPYPPAEDVVAKDGTFASGGFVPMKYLEDYLVPDQSTLAGQRTEWDDPIQNTVWRPRWTGEKTLKIDMDDHIEDYSAGTDLEMFGGVDCGRSPYPVLRAVDKYVSFESPEGDGVVKKKVWDGVTGTVFNMPSTPLEDDFEPEDERLRRMGMLHRGRDQPRKDIFPLDIRRVDRQDTNVIKRKGPSPLLRDGEKELQFSWRDPLRSYSDLPDTDPWWITSEQERLRDVPPRKYPPPERSSSDDRGNDGTFLYTDDSLWKEEFENDSLHHSRYFVTNLHGGTLIINGMEVRKGCVAGPLPEFAVIECPGDQIAFWFGVGGRFWGEGNADTYYDARWDTLRQVEGWEHVALSAGQVWHTKIMDRLRRELTGNRLEDDEAWAAWKSAEAAPEIPEPNGPMQFPEVQLAIDFDAFPRRVVPECGIAPFEPDSFYTEEDEFRWLKTRAQPLEQAASQVVQYSTIHPTPETFWATEPNAQPPLPLECKMQRDAEKRFQSDKTRILDQQRAATKHYVAQKSKREQRAAHKKDQEDQKKRKLHDAFPKPSAKKNRRELNVAQAEAYANRKKDEAQSMEDKRIWTEYMAREAAKARKQQDHPWYTDQMWEGQLEDEVNRLQDLWVKTNFEREKAGLMALKGISPREQANLDKERLAHLLKNHKQKTAEKAMHVQHLNQVRNPEEQQEQGTLDDNHQGNEDPKGKKRTAEDAGLTDHEKRVHRRMDLYHAESKNLERNLRLEKAHARKTADAARVNRAVNGLFPAFDQVQAVVPPPPFTPTRLPRAELPPWKPPPSPDFYPSSSNKRTNIPSSYTAPSPLPGFSSIPQTRAAAGTASSVQTGPNRANANPVIPKSTRLPVSPLGNERGSSALFSPIPGPDFSYSSSPPRRLDTPSEPSTSTSSQENSPSPTPLRQPTAEPAKQDEIPTSNFNADDYLSQDDLQARDPQIQLNYVLSASLQNIPGAPMCEQHEEVLERAKRARQPLAQYLSSIYGLTLTEYLEEQLDSTSEIDEGWYEGWDDGWEDYWDEDILQNHVPFPAVDEKMTKHIHKMLTTAAWQEIDESGLHATTWAIEKNERRTENYDPTWTVEREIRDATKRVVRQLRREPEHERGATMRKILDGFKGIERDIATQEGLFQPVRWRWGRKWCAV